MKSIILTRDRNAVYETITFPDKELKRKFLKKIYLNNPEIPVDTTDEQLEKIAQRVLYVSTHNTYIALGVSKRTLDEILETNKDKEELYGGIELIVELDNIPLIFKRTDYAKIYNIKIGPQNVVMLDTSNDIDEEDIEEMKRCAFATKIEAVTKEMFKD